MTQFPFMYKSFFWIVWMMLCLTRAYASVDSLRLEQEGSQYYVVHKVEQGETLYALSKRYSSAVDIIRQANGGLSQGLALGAVIRVPISAPKVVHASSASVVSTAVEPGMHEVKQGETLFSLAKRYGFTVEQLKLWNNMSSNELTIGQKLTLKAPVKDVVSDAASTQVKEQHSTPPQASDAAPLPARDSSMATDTKKAKESTQHKLEETTANVAEKESAPKLQGVEVAKAKGTRQMDMTALIDPSHDEGIEPYSPVSKENMTQKKKSDFKKISESGLAEIITEQGDTQKYLALHRTAPVGTIIQVENEMNNVVVFVRVIGKLPDTGANDKLTIKLTKKAAQALGAIDKRFPVQLSYIP
jgi:LysM repeat protein